MSVPGLRSGSGPNPQTRIPGATPPVGAHTTDTSTKVSKTGRKVRVRGRVMGTPGKVPADVYAQVIKGKQRGRRNPNVLGKREV